MAPVDGVEFARMIRGLPDNVMSMVPIIMITGQLTLARINEARNAGVNEFVAKPITARAIVERLFQIIQHPRPFVRTDSYFGPDRRRKQDPDYQGPKRRSTDGPRPLSQIEI
jgi:PleD family two-component response regulator